jgi:uncharacterized protein (DUF983 family)
MSEESMYLDPNPLHLSKILKMHNNCSHCGFQYQIEPSFFYGAMYGYGLNVAIGIATFIISHIIFNSTLKAAFIAIIVALVVLFPFVIRWARIYILICLSPMIRISRNNRYL